MRLTFEEFLHFFYFNKVTFESDTENLVELLSLEKFCEQKIQENAVEIINSDGFLEMNSENVCDWFNSSVQLG